MSNTSKALGLILILLRGAGALACPALGGTYQRSVGWFHDEQLSVVQDRCHSVTLIYGQSRKVFDEASPRFLLDGGWHAVASGRQYQASFNDGQVVIFWRGGGGKDAGPQSSLYLDGNGLLTSVRVSEFGRREVLSYTRVETHEVPTTAVEVGFDEAVGWRVTDGERQPLTPLLEHVERTLAELATTAVYSCDVKGERSRSRENPGLLVYDVNACRVVDVVRRTGR